MLTDFVTPGHGRLTIVRVMTMEKFKTHAGPKSFDDIVSEVMRKPKETQVLAARAVLPGEHPDPSATVNIGPADFDRRFELMKRRTAPKEWDVDLNASWEKEFQSYHSTVATGPVGPTGPYPIAPGANGPAGPLNTHIPTAPASSGILPERDRAEVDLRKAIRRCHKDGVPLERMVEIFRLELVDAVHDD